jgi:hypothetical protein
MMNDDKYHLVHTNDIRFIIFGIGGKKDNSTLRDFWISRINIHTPSDSMLCKISSDERYEYSKYPQRILNILLGIKYGLKMDIPSGLRRNLFRIINAFYWDYAN